jgi:hypothetical protein
LTFDVLKRGKPAGVKPAALTSPRPDAPRIVLKQNDVRPATSEEAGLAWKGAVCTENLNPNVVVMKSAQEGVRTYDAESLNRSAVRQSHSAKVKPVR